MSASQAIRDGQLDRALAELQQEVRRDPADAKHRIFLFQLLAVRGEWERALVQLNTAAELDASVLAMAQMYRETLRCEVLRAEIFAGKRSPMVFGQPPEWIGCLIEALRLTATGNHDAAAPLREQALDTAPAVSGQMDDRRFEWLADADLRLGPVLEAVVAGRYLWIPLENIRRIEIEKPADLRDVVWMPAHFTWTNGGDAVGVIPTRYPGSETSADDLVRLARMTTWFEAASGVRLGLGQRMLATDEADFPLMDVRRIEFDELAGPAN